MGKAKRIKTRREEEKQNPSLPSSKYYKIPKKVRVPAHKYAWDEFLVDSALFGYKKLSSKDGSRDDVKAKFGEIYKNAKKLMEEQSA